MIKELVPIVLSCAVWGPYFARCTALLQCDNLCLVAAISKGSSKDKTVMHLLRSLWFFAATFDIHIVTEHIAGTNNYKADMLSRNNITQFLLSNPDTPITDSTSSAPSSHHISTGTRLDIKFLQIMLYRYYHYDISPATRPTYSSSQISYLNFCSMIQHNPIPAHESTILLFFMHLATSGLSHTTIKMYLSAIHSMHVATGQHTVFHQQLTPWLQQVLKGIQWTQAISKPSWIRQPITLDIMKAIFDLLLKRPAFYDNAMLWAACCTAFFRLSPQ